MKKLPIVLFFCLSISAVKAQDPTEAIQRAQAVKDTPYASPPNPSATFDCASLTQYAYQPFFHLPTTVAAQAALGTPVNAIGELQRGDLVFWDTHLNRLVNHVGIYVGNNIAIAANYTHGVEEFDLTLNYWQTRFMFGRRLPGIAVALSPFGTSTATIGYVVQAVTRKRQPCLWPGESLYP